MMIAATFVAPISFSMRVMAICAISGPFESAVAVRVRRRDAVDLGGERAEGVLVGHGLRGQGHRQVGAAVVAVLDDDDRLPLGVGAGDLHRVLDGLGTGVEQCRALLVVTGGEAVEGLAHLDVAGVGGHHEAGVGELGDLLLDAGDDLGVGVADGGDGDAGAHVDERVAVDVEQDAAAGLGDVDRQGDADAGGHGMRSCGPAAPASAGPGCSSRAGAPGAGRWWSSRCDRRWRSSRFLPGSVVRA